MLFRNTLAQSGSTLVGFLFSFLLAPLMITRLGLDKFGIWAVTGAFATYAGLLDLGVGLSLARFIAIFDAEGENDKIREAVGLGMLVVATVGALAMIAVAALAPFLSEQLGVLGAGDMRIVVLASVAIWTFNGWGGVFTGVGIGRRKMVPPNVALVVSNSFNFAFSVTALLISQSVVVYALANAAAAALSVLPAYISMRVVWPGRHFAAPGWRFLKEVLSFSLKNQVGWIAELVNFQTDKVVIALTVDIHAAAVYEIASRVVLGVRSAAILTVSALIPTAAARITEEGREVVGAMFRRYLLPSCAIAFPVFIAASVASPFLLVAWLAKAPGDSVLLVPFLTLAYLLNSTTGVGSTIAIAAGHPGMPSINASMIAVLNIILTVALAPVFGLWGVVGGTFLALTIGSLVFNQRFLRFFNLPTSDYIDGILPAAALGFGLAIPSAVLALVVGVPGSRPAAAAWLLLSMVLYVIPYWILASRRGMLPEKLSFGRRPAASPSPSP